MARPCYFLQSKVGLRRDAATPATDIGYKGRGPQVIPRSEQIMQPQTPHICSGLLVQFSITGCFYPPTARECAAGAGEEHDTATKNDARADNDSWYIHFSSPGSRPTHGCSLVTRCAVWDLRWSGEGNWASELLNNNEAVGVGIQVGNKIKQSASYGASLQFLYSNSMATQWT